MEVVVSVLMITYNHECYIKQAIESVLNQKCNFRIELIIGEDCSEDNTKQICMEYISKYPEINLLTSEINLGAIPNFIRTLDACNGKYIAICEGDDYWTDSYKLQKQVDYLESNPDYGLVHGDVNHLYQETGELSNAYNKTNNIKIPQGEIFEDLMIPGHFIKTMTVCFRRELIEKHYLKDNEIMSKDWRMVDISIWLALSYHTKFYYFNEVFATYRLLPESMSRSKNIIKQHKFNLLVYDIRFYFADKFNCINQLKYTITIFYYRMLLRDSILLKDKKMSKKAINHLLRMKKFGIKDFLRFVYHYYIKYNNYSF